MLSVGGLTGSQGKAGVAVRLLNTLPGPPVDLPGGEFKAEMIEDRAKLMYALPDEDADPRRWLPSWLEPEDVVAGLSIELANDAVWVGGRKDAKFRVESLQVFTRPLKLGEAAV
jgi:hypothetical protein